ncbi:MAG: FKBP-type peptidyl-prolyl cis-trans isomerase [Pseudomonadota bacterium]
MNNALLKTLGFSCLTAVISMSAPQAKEEPTPTQKSAQGKVQMPSGLIIEDITVGGGITPEEGQTVVVHYTGTLENGKKFDSSHDRGKPFRFTLGAGEVIKGWDEGLATMKIGGKRKLTIPPELGYGARGAGAAIPANATLIFDVELVDVE